MNPCSKNSGIDETNLDVSSVRAAFIFPASQGSRLQKTEVVFLFFVITYEQFDGPRLKNSGFMGVLDFSTNPGNHEDDDFPFFLKSEHLLSTNAISINKNM